MSDNDFQDRLETIDREQSQNTPEMLQKKEDIRIKKQQIKDEHAKNYNTLGQKRINYEGTTNDDGSLKSPFSRMQQPTGEFEQQLQNRVNQEGLSNEAQFTQNQQLDQSTRGQLGIQAGQEEALAMRGGAGGGARERLAQSGQDQLALNQQGIRANVAGQDMQSKLGLQKQLATNEVNKSNADVATAVGDQGQRQEFGLRMFEKESEAIAAIKNSKAQADASGGGGGSWLCTEVAKKVRKYTYDEKTALTNCIKFGMKDYKELTNYYLYKCSPLVKIMNSKNFDYNKIVEPILEVIELSKQGNYDESYNLYLGMVKVLAKKYWKSGYGEIVAIEDKKTEDLIIPKESKQELQKELGVK